MQWHQLPVNFIIGDRIDYDGEVLGSIMSINLGRGGVGWICGTQLVQMTVFSGSLLRFEDCVL